MWNYTSTTRFHCNIWPDACAIKQHHEPNPAATWEPGWLWQDKEEEEEEEEEEEGGEEATFEKKKKM